MKKCILLALVVLSSSFMVASMLVPARGQPPAREDWLDARWHHRLFLTVDAAGHARRDYPIEINIDFSSYIATGDVIDVNSIRVLENGNIVPVQYDSSSTKAGKLIFLATGTTAPAVQRRFTVYFDTVANGLKPAADYGDSTEFLANIERIYNGTSESDLVPGPDWFTALHMPSNMDADEWNHANWTVGTIKSTRLLWGDAWNGTDTIRWNVVITVYRGSYTAYLNVYNNGTQQERAWASSVANFSTGCPQGAGPYDFLDEGLAVATGDWIVSNFTTLAGTKAGWNGTAELMADSDTDIYDQPSDALETSQYIGYVPGQLTYDLGTSVHEISLLYKYDGMIYSLVDVSRYTLDAGRQSFTINNADSYFNNTVEFVVYSTVKYFQAGDWLYVMGRNASTDHVVFYDTDGPDGVDHAYPVGMGVAFPQVTAANDMVVEFWQIAREGEVNYLVNVSLNCNEWWWDDVANADKGLSEAELHDLAANDFDLALRYYNDTASPASDAQQLAASLANPAPISIASQEDSIPLSLAMHSPVDGQTFFAGPAGGSYPLHAIIPVNVTAAGDTLYSLSYTLGTSGSPVSFTGTAMLNISVLEGDPDVKQYNLTITAQDTNGTVVSEVLTFNVSKPLAFDPAVMIIVIAAIAGGIAVFVWFGIKKGWIKLNRNR